MSGTTYIATKAASSLVKRVRPHLVNRFLQKYYPLNQKSYVIDFERIPTIRLNHLSSDFSIEVGVQLRNFDWYEIEVHQYECQVVINGAPISPATDGRLQTLKPGGALQFVVQHPLTPGEAKRIEATFRNQELKVARFGFLFSIKSDLEQEPLIRATKLTA